MKKILILLIISLVFITGCGKETKDDLSKNDTKVTENNTVNNTNNTNNKNENKTEEKNESKPENTEKKEPSLGENMYIKVSDGKIHKYTYTYKEEATCNKQGDEHFDEVNPTHPYVIYGCDKIKDAKGNILWGVYFYSAPDENSIFYY